MAQRSRQPTRPPRAGDPLTAGQARTIAAAVSRAHVEQLGKQLATATLNTLQRELTVVAASHAALYARLERLERRTWSHRCRHLIARSRAIVRGLRARLPARPIAPPTSEVASEVAPEVTS